MGEVSKGLFALLGACVIWGLAPLFYKLFTHIGPLEILSHRVLWSLVFFGVLLGLQGRMGPLFAVLRSPRSIALTGLAALFITTNWLLFIWAIQLERVVEASLGYYIFPLVAVLMGWLWFGEQLSGLKLLAVSLAAIAVLVLIVGLGKTPWISLVLAGSFGAYVVLKKRSPIGPILSVTAEVLLLAPFALLWLCGVHFLGWQGLTGQPGGYFAGNGRDTLLLILSGPLTAGPLMLFSYASQRLSLSTVGLLQYLNPTLQFGVAVLIFREPFGAYHAVAFALIWVALALYSGQTMLQEQACRKAANGQGTASNTAQ